MRRAWNPVPFPLRNRTIALAATAPASWLGLGRCALGLGLPLAGRSSEVAERLQVLVSSHLAARVARAHDRQRIVGRTVMLPTVPVMKAPVPAAIDKQEEDDEQDRADDSENRPLDRACSRLVHGRRV